MVYFVVVTLSTVGYGDIAPVTVTGRMTIIVVIGSALVLIPKQTNELIRLLGLQSVYARRKYNYNPEIPHLVISGSLTYAAVRDFFTELFHPDHGSQDKNAVLLHPCTPSAELETLLRNPAYGVSVCYLEGRPMSDRDLRRASVHKAKTLIFLANKYASDPVEEDNSIILQALSMKKFVRSQYHEDVRLCIQLIRPESKGHYYASTGQSDLDNLICLEEIKFSLLAKSCLCPGIAAMVSNLIMSAGEPPEGIHEPWLEQYCTGRGHEIYRAPLSPKFSEMSFSAAATVIYKQFEGILFALEVQVAGQTLIRLNPGQYIIPDTLRNGVHAFLICEDKKIADEVSAYGLDEAEYSEFATNMAALHGHVAGSSTSQPTSAANRFASFITGHLRLNKDSSGGGRDVGAGVGKLAPNKVAPSSLAKIGFVLGQDEEEDEMDFGAVDDEAQAELEQTTLMNMYVMEDEKIPLAAVTKESIKDSLEISNHIVVCGVVPSMFYFIAPLRAKYLKEFKPIVILNPTLPPDTVWRSICQFTGVYFILGSPLSEDDLEKANIKRANKAVVFSSTISRSNSTKEEMFDAETIFIYKAIKKANPLVQIITEVVHATNMEYLWPRVDLELTKTGYFLTPLFAAGDVYLASMLDTLICQAFYNPHIVTILQQIITGDHSTNPIISALCNSTGLVQSNLWQIPVPRDYSNRSFKDMYAYLASRDIITMGLYRGATAFSNPLPFVFTNPPPHTRLTPMDRVFVLAFDMPMDLLYESDVEPASVPISAHELIRRAREEEERNKTVTLGGIMALLNQLLDNKSSTGTATLAVISSMYSQIENLKKELSRVKRSLDDKDDEIVEKCRQALKQELSALAI
eukprot:GILI01003843.1.p1 GENE.GILI01003843.1~~GILI01003843.1.p1  ORF type:complete len:913 (+),score=151.79 GILI01003843.1:165-2741(+)